MVKTSQEFLCLNLLIISAIFSLDKLGVWAVRNLAGVPTND